MKTYYIGEDDALSIRVLRFMRDKQIEPGSVAVLEVSHDDDCPKLYGGPRCACNPEFELVKVSA